MCVWLRITSGPRQGRVLVLSQVDAVMATVIMTLYQQLDWIWNPLRRHTSANAGEDISGDV